MLSRMWSGMGWVARKMFFCNDPEDDQEWQPHQVERNSAAVFAQFHADLVPRYKAIKPEGPSFTVWNRSFQKLCDQSRRQKMPVLLVCLRDNSPQNYRLVAEALAVSTAAVDNYLVVGFNLADPPMPQIKELIRMPAETPAAFYVTFVSHDLKIKIMRRFTLPSTRDGALFDFLQESTTLFQIQCEEDPQYQQLEML